MLGYHLRAPHQLASTQLAGRSDKMPNMLPNGPSQMDEIRHCLSLLLHSFWIPFLLPLLLVLISLLLKLPFSSPPPASISLCHSSPHMRQTSLCQKRFLSEGGFLIFLSGAFFLRLLDSDQPSPSADHTATGQAGPNRSLNAVSAQMGRSELRVRRKSLVCDSAGGQESRLDHCVRVKLWVWGCGVLFFFGLNNNKKNIAMMADIFLCFLEKGSRENENGCQHETSR